MSIIVTLAALSLGTALIAGCSSDDAPPAGPASVVDVPASTSVVDETGSTVVSVPAAGSAPTAPATTQRASGTLPVLVINGPAQVGLTTPP